MSVRVHNLLTGELESSYATSILGAPEKHVRVKKEDLLPYGFRERQFRPDGTFEPGLMVPVPVWFIEGEKEKILIDTGLGDCQEIMALQARYGIDYVARKTREQEIEAAFAAKRLTPDDIDVVVLTHLHFDHIGNTERFRNARFIVQSVEVPLLLSPPKFAIFYYREWAHKITGVLDRLEPIQGNLRLTKNVELVRLGGHAPGQMVVFVQTDQGKVCLASDFLYNYSNLRNEWPMGPVWSIDEWVSGLRYIKAHADLIVPNHDYEFYQHHPDGILG